MVPRRYAAAVAALLVGFIVAGCGKSDLEKLNTEDIPKLNASIASTQQGLDRQYPRALKQAQQCRQQIDREFAEDDAAYLDMTDTHLAKADASYKAAQSTLAQAGSPMQPNFKEWSERVQNQVNAANSAATKAKGQMKHAINELNAVCAQFRELSQEYIRTFLWFEVDDYWPDEYYDDYYSACYYGEQVSKVGADGRTQEVIISDEEGVATYENNDEQERNWKVFTVDDYVQLVNRGIIKPMKKDDPDDTNVGYYLCGEDPQNGKYGALGEPPVTLVKERGMLKMEMEDGPDTFVGNYRYGSWCVPDATGNYVKIPEDQDPPANAEWCWNQKPGGSTGYYWLFLNNGWHQGPRRCVYCKPTTWRSGSGMVRDSTLARFNRTNASSVRGAGDIGGGPGTGK